MTRIELQMEKVMKARVIQFTVVAMGIIVWSGFAAAQQITQKPGIPAELANKLQPPTPTPVPPDYTIGVDDVLTINVFGDTTLSGDVVVRPDGKITLPFGEDILALGLRTDELKKKVLQEIGKKYNENEPPAITIQVKQINSRRVYITGQVGKPGPYPVTGSMTLIQLISMAGGLLEFSDEKNIVIISATLKDKNGQPLMLKANYKDALSGKNLLRNNPELRPGDQVLVGGGF
jgi:polysaccharide export outer membrane protein